MHYIISYSHDGINMEIKKITGIAYDSVLFVGAIEDRVCEMLKIKKIEFQEYLIENYNAHKYIYEKEGKIFANDYSEVRFKNRPDAESALEWIESRLMIIKLSGE